MAGFDLTTWFFEENSENEQTQLLFPPPSNDVFLSAQLLPPSISDLYGNFDTGLQLDIPLSGHFMSDPYIFDGRSIPHDDSLQHLPLITSQCATAAEPPSSPRLEWDSSFCSAAMMPYDRYGDSETSDCTSESGSNETDDIPRLYMPSHYDEEAFLFQHFEEQEENDRFAIRTQRERNKHPIRFIKCSRRPYQCSDCEHTFKRLHDYRRHILTHMAKSNADHEYRWHCDICDQSFTRFFALKRHHNRKHKTFAFERVKAPRAPPTPNCLIPTTAFTMRAY